ncbi:hypothetical protein [Actinomadura violacea]|uniref:Uncharacterized protein n=1 Tax=Actinomadura violacea TaxID=2819934 RepID=A0ABS3RRU9_9ACTN|nr:hypothetical protein [Actinomadura violacea]MBO2459377.1 hypothetical protein [Actinomadura violacea]
MSVVQKWLSGLIGLGALYLVVSNPNGVYKAGQAIRNIVGGTESDIISGGKR